MQQPALKGEEVGEAQAISAAHFVWVLGSLCRIHRVPFDASLLLQQFPPPYARHSLIEAARALGFKAGELALSDRKLREAPLPLVVFLNEKSAVPALILKQDGERFLYVEAGSDVPNARRAADFHELFDSAAILIGHEAPADERAQGFEDEPRKVGFGWFVPY